VRPLGWLAIAQLEPGGRIPGDPTARTEPVLDRLTTLRDALSAMFDAGAGSAVVVDAGGRVAGVVEVGTIARAVHPAQLEPVGG
jgi:CBS domain.